MNAYNPSDWGRQAVVPGQYVPHSAINPATRNRDTRNYTGHEASLPEPPPPYTASPTAAPASAPSVQPSPRTASGAQATSPAGTLNSYGNMSMSSAGTSGFSAHRAAVLSQQTSPTNFPPPPSGQRDRSTSRARGMLSNISAIASRHRGDSTSAAPGMEVPQRGVSDSYGRPVHQAPAPLGRAPEPAAAPLPPAARRAASVDAVGAGHANTRGQQREPAASSNSAWEPGMRLPPPPPGPPPGSRSQSLSRAPGRTSDDGSSIVAPLPTRALASVTRLEPVPPTPADWVDEDAAPAGRAATAAPAAPSQLPAAPPRGGLQLNTNVQESPAARRNDSANFIHTAIEPRSMHSRMGSSEMPLANSSRTTARGLRERRIESRARSREPQSALEQNGDPWANLPDDSIPADLTISTSTARSALTRRPHVSKASPSPRAAHSGTSGLRNETTVEDSDSRPTPNHNHSQHQQQPQPQQQQQHQQQPPLHQQPLSASGHGDLARATPPYSAHSDWPQNTPRSSKQVTIAGSKALPTPPMNSAGQRTSAPLLSSKSLHTPSAETPRSSAMSPPATAYSQPTPSLKPSDSLAKSSLQRFQTFLDREASASSDREKLELFAEFIVHESRVRRDRYSEAFDRLGSDVLDLTRDMWRSFGIKRERTPTMGSSGARATPRETPREESFAMHEPSSASSSRSGAAFTPQSEDEPPTTSSSAGRNRSDSRAAYRPQLSPIPSMAQSTVPDEEDSRGRSASRWWEASNENDSVGNGRRPIERTKRESKYMGLPKSARENLQWDMAEPSPSYGNITPGPSQPFPMYGANEYPPEKVGWHEEATPSRLTVFTPRSAPPTPQPPKLDVSRLITLPPPYPRHHPAVNNSHPELSSIRAIHRSLVDTDERSMVRESYSANRAPSSSQEDLSTVDERRREFRMGIQTKVAHGRMSFADAAKAEADFEDQEMKKARNAAQQDFENFQAAVLSPLSAGVSEKITKASASIDQLRQSLADDAENHDPSKTQEEGDEQPELLEKLTLLKWIFEAREQLHKEMFDLQTESDEKYKKIVVAPYRITGNQEKIREVEAFFTKDGRDRKIAHETKIRQRFEDLHKMIDQHVTRGVEVQLSAFWDIAPPLLELVQKVPSRLYGFDIQIPGQEYDENPSYVDFPMQYLYSLLLHTERSAYQFIESQTNLLCLLHEVKMGVMNASCKLMETQRYLAGEDFASVEREMQAVRKDEDARLTSDLKERVELVEEQWRSALGGGLQKCESRIEAFLVQQGGWDESLKE